MFRLHRLTLAAGAAALAASPLTAQAPRPLRSAAETITADDLSRHLHVIAADSMGGRDTPSPGLDKTAQYVADQFKQFGLKPGGPDGSWFQKYPISQRKLDVAGSHVGFMVGATHVHAGLDRDARLLFGSVPKMGTGGATVLFGGALDPHMVEGQDLKGKVALVVIDFSKPIGPAIQGTVGSMMQAGARGVVLISNKDSTTFGRQVQGQGGIRVSVGDESVPPVIEVHQRALGQVLQAAGVDPDQVRSSTEQVRKDLPDLQVMLDLKENTIQQVWAPNTIGILEGTDPVLKNEYVVFSAHMDHIGTAGAGSGQCQARGDDSICNGADDDGSGTVSVIELAEAFSQKGARPKRSILFLTVSGEEKGLWGSGYFSNNPTVPLPQIVADINIDMVGRNWQDTIVAIRKEHSDLGATLNRVASQHPELNMAAIDDRWPEENFYRRSDHFNFARKGVPILFFFNGVHPDYHQATDAPEKVDYEKMSRIDRLLFYLGQEVANSPERPQWNPASKAKIVDAS